MRYTDPKNACILIWHLKAQHTLSDFSHFINKLFHVIGSRIFLVIWRSSNVEELDLNESQRKQKGLPKQEIP